ncbi:hypothetical protein EVAR_90314_1 [Eumeta japonica]|uniref:Uncharacterized protein n=1 Tax=Eumeta variegata TaxID=151549 RepID=A0A4C1ZKZ1_EUMVA|nr:hypothetical protein EVAR_90314_1 [Eumeta japonica]
MSIKQFSSIARPKRTLPRARSSALIKLFAFCADRRPAAPRDSPGPADRESAAPPAATLHSLIIINYFRLNHWLPNGVNEVICSELWGWPFPFRERQTRTDLGPPALEGAPRRYQVSPAHPPSSLTPSSVPSLLGL